MSAAVSGDAAFWRCHDCNVAVTVQAKGRPGKCWRCGVLPASVEGEGWVLLREGDLYPTERRFAGVALSPCTESLRVDGGLYRLVWLWKQSDDPRYLWIKYEWHLDDSYPLLREAG